MKLSLKVGIVSAIFLLVILAFGWGIFPMLLSSKIKSQVVLKPDNEIRKMYVKVPFPLDFKVYMFNVTNAMQVQNGDTPVVDEIGPYCFEEWKDKLNVVDHEEDDTLEFNPRDTFIFDQEKTGELTMDEVITIPNPLIVGMINTVARDKPAMLTLVAKAINGIYRNPESIFLTASVREILFTGVLINCTVTDFAAKAVCSQLKTEAKDLVQVGESDFLFSLFGPKNATMGGRFKVMRGSKNSHDVGRVLSYENRSEMSVWTTKECNQYQGTDGTIFPPFLTKEEGLVSFAPDLCRSLGAVYASDAQYQGIPVYKYMATLGDMSTNEAEKCFCPTPDTCLKKGLMDISKCAGAPIVVSQPHFFNSDESYLKKVRGLRPREKEHEIFIYFEAYTGSPVAARKRLQFNLPLQPYEKVALFKSLPEVMLPLFWVEEGIDLNSTYVKQLSSFFKIKKIVGVTKWVIFTLSLLGIGVAAYLYIQQNPKINITPVHKVQPAAENSKSSVISMINQSNTDNGSNNNGVKNFAFLKREFEKY